MHLNTKLHEGGERDASDRLKKCDKMVTFSCNPLTHPKHPMVTWLSLPLRHRLAVVAWTQQMMRPKRHGVRLWAVNNTADTGFVGTKKKSISRKSEAKKKEISLGRYHKTSL